MDDSMSRPLPLPVRLEKQDAERGPGHPKLSRILWAADALQDLARGAWVGSPGLLSARKLAFFRLVELSGSNDVAHSKGTIKKYGLAWYVTVHLNCISPCRILVSTHSQQVAAHFAHECLIVMKFYMSAYSRNRFTMQQVSLARAKGLHNAESSSMTSVYCVDQACNIC